MPMSHTNRVCIFISLFFVFSFFPRPTPAYNYATGAEGGPGIDLMVNASYVFNGDWVRLNFTNIPPENRGKDQNCWIGLFNSTASVNAFEPPSYFPWTAPWVTPAPVKFMWCNETSDLGFEATGNGYLEVVLHNLRSDFIFYLFLDPINATKLTTTPVSSFIVHMLNKELPNQGRIARTSNPTEMRVSWTSMMGNDVGASIRWGIASLSENSIGAVGSTYTPADLCAAPATTVGWWDPGHFYTGVITGLKPNTRYVYQYGSPRYGWSDIKSFMSAPPVDPHQEQRILIIADVGVTQIDGWQYHWTEPNAYATVAGLLATRNLSQSEILLHVGDISYATGYLSKWDEFLHAMNDLTSGLPYMTVEGNHERDSPDSGSVIGTTDSGGECGVTTWSRFLMPTANQSEYWYSFDHGSIHIVMINTELNVSVGSPQWTFVQNDLLRVNRSVTPWVIFAGHRPMYSSGMNPMRNPYFSDPLEPLIYAGKVDMAFWGHMHAAELTYAVYNSTVMNVTNGYDAPVHAVIGNGGQPLVLTPQTAPWMRFLPTTQYYGWSELIAHNATHLTFTMYKDFENTITENITIVRPWPRPY